ncbi:ribonuclease G [Mangrovimicrobium sediminis]|uniref:Ribonuclease G n=1 Tax=Mangrovimicrobium sediminis TaxID=2562682 RepID=A0A4Z0LYD0_9GAMM|nr:ribonuclease G [Haliea sp. SAOS-164]TGD72095.1 ribonuclease G [Haliea sp. SAOS-164]
MSEEILVNITPMETRVAVVDNGAAQEVLIERSNSRGMLGNIYSGKVVRVLPGMQAAFVDIGAERTSFIHVSDLLLPGQEGRARGAVENYLREGQKLVVQVTKEPLGTKGARLTTELSVSSRYLVYMPGGNHVGVSQRIDDAGERERLQALLAEGRTAEDMAGEGGFILRTAAEGVGLEELRGDLRYLQRLWAAVSRRAAAARKPELLYAELPLHLRTVRDLVRPGVERIMVDSRENFHALQEFCTDYMPEVSERLEHYAGERPLFDLHGIETEIQRALGRKVELKSGGYLVIDQTEAMSTIDVNTGSYVGRRNLEETIFKTNLEAATMLARQLRLRNLGGIIIVDFIDMQDEEHRRQVQRTLEKAMARDPARNKITGVSELGLVEMTRERTRESLSQLLCEECPVCSGRGLVKTAETICYEIFREIMRDARAYDTDQLMVLAAQDVIDRLLDEESANVADLEEFIGKRISLRVEPDTHPEHFDIVLF